MRADDEVQMPYAELVDHVIGGVSAVMAVNLAGKPVHHGGVDRPVCVRYGPGGSVPCIQQAPVTIGFHQNHIALCIIACHIEIINSVASGGMGQRPVLIHGKKCRQHQEERQNIFETGVILHDFNLSNIDIKTDNNSEYSNMLHESTATTKCHISVL